MEKWTMDLASLVFVGKKRPRPGVAGGGGWWRQGAWCVRTGVSPSGGEGVGPVGIGFGVVGGLVLVGDGVAKGFVVLGDVVAAA